MVKLFNSRSTNRTHEPRFIARTLSTPYTQRTIQWQIRRMSNQKDEHRTTACFKRRAAQWNATRSKSRQVQFATSTSAHAAFTEVRGHKHRQSIQATLVKKTRHRFCYENTFSANRRPVWDRRVFNDSSNAQAKRRDCCRLTCIIRFGSAKSVYPVHTGEDSTSTLYLRSH